MGHGIVLTVPSWWLGWYSRYSLCCGVGEPGQPLGISVPCKLLGCEPRAQAHPPPGNWLDVTGLHSTRVDRWAGGGGWEGWREEQRGVAEKVPRPRGPVCWPPQAGPLHPAPPPCALSTHTYPAPLGRYQSWWPLQE